MNRRVLYLSVAAAAISAASSASAQETAGQPVASGEAWDGAGPSADAIIVTARRRAEDVSKVPISISAFSGETLARKSIASTRDLTKITPGVNIIGATVLSTPFITIRGLSRVAAGPGAPGVITYFNDVPLATYGAIQPTFDLDNVQVLKGPQGTLFGRNAIGGAVLMNSKRPTYDFGGYVEGEYGRFNTARLEGAVNLPIVDDVLAVRVAAQQSRTDGFTDGKLYSPYSYDPVTFSETPGQFMGDIHLDERDDLSLRASVLFEPASGISNLTVVDYTRYSGATPAASVGFTDETPLYLLPADDLNAIGLGGIYLPTNQCGTSPSCDIRLAVEAAQRDPRTQYTEMVPRERITTFGISNTTTIDLGAATLKNIFAFRTLDLVVNADNDAVAQSALGVTGANKDHQFTNELQISGEAFSDRLKYVFGGFYYETVPQDHVGFQANSVVVFQGISNGVSANFLKETSKALYGQIDYDISSLIPGLTLTAGYRYTWDKQSGCVYAAEYGFGAGGIPVPPGTLPYLPMVEECKTGTFPVDPNAAFQEFGNFRAKSSEGTYTFTASWEASPDLMFYATARKGYRAGGYNAGALPTTPVDTSSLRTFAPETLTDVEIGAKGRFDFGGVFGSFSFDLFRGKDKGYQYFQQLNAIGQLPANGLLLNKADVTIEGVEGLLTISPVEGLTLGGNFAYTTASVDELTIPTALFDYVVAVAPGSLPLIQDFAITNQPKWTANANVEYVARNVIGGADAIVNFDYHYQSDYPALLPVPSYSTIDGRVTLAGLVDGGLDLSVFMRNLTDETYFQGPSTAPALGILTYILAPPRTFGVSLKYRFGGS